MRWLLFWITVSVVGLFGAVASANSVRFGRRVARETREMWAGCGEARPIDRGRLAGLPAPVRPYLTRALGDRTHAVRTVRFRHGGRFRTRLDGPWQPITGRQYEAADTPGFIWWGRLQVAPGIWVDARDRSLNGVGGMFVALESTFTLFDRSGPELDQGSLLRLLSDLVVFPTAFLDEGHLTWSSVSDTQARATLCVQGRDVSGVFEFGTDALPRAFHANRYFDSGRGQPVLRAWSGDYGDYRWVAGMLVPHHFVGYWHVDGARIPYVDFQLETPEYDVIRPY